MWVTSRMASWQTDNLKYPAETMRRLGQTDLCCGDRHSHHPESQTQARS